MTVHIAITCETLRGGDVFTPPVVEGGWGATRRTFLAPGFTPAIYQVALAADGTPSVLQRIPLHPLLTGEFVYRLSPPDPSSGVKQRDISVSGIYAIDANRLVVDEHDNVTDVPGAGQKRVGRALGVAGDGQDVGRAGVQRPPGGRVRAAHRRRRRAADRHLQHHPHVHVVTTNPW